MTKIPIIIIFIFFSFFFIIIIIVTKEETKVLCVLQVLANYNDIQLGIIEKIVQN